MEVHVTTPFPLFELLYQAVTTQNAISASAELTNEQQCEVIQSISQMTQETHEAVFNLIRRFSLRWDRYVPGIFDVPYQGEKIPSVNKSISVAPSSNDIRFSLDKLPRLLQWMIYTFCKMYHLKLQEDNEKEIYSTIEKIVAVSQCKPNPAVKELIAENTVDVEAVTTDSIQTPVSISTTDVVTI